MRLWAPSEKNLHREREPSSSGAKKKRESERVQKGEGAGTSEEPPQLSLVDSTTGESPQKVDSEGDVKMDS